ncbi:TOMM precursor leader peptide-binding protein [Sorangium sp. So ce429]
MLLLVLSLLLLLLEYRAKAMLKLLKPRLKGSLHCQTVDECTVVLLDEVDCSRLDGRIYPSLLPLLDGRRTVPELMQTLMAQDVPPPELLYALKVLEDGQYLVEGDADIDPAIAAFWHTRGVSAAMARSRQENARVSVVAVGAVSPEPLLGALHSAGVSIAPEGALRVAVVDDYLREELADINAKMIEEGRSWLLFKPVGRFVWLGPIFRPGRTGCWACLEQRLRCNRQMDEFLNRVSGHAGPLVLSKADHPATSRAVHHLAAAQIAEVLALEASSVLDGAVVTFDTMKLETERHALTRRPQCSACGDGAYFSRAPRRVELTSRPKAFTADGGHRSALPSTTYERLRHQVSPITGVVTCLTRFDEQSANGLTFAYSAGHNFAMPNDDIQALFTNLRSRSGGKGMTDIQAKVSAIGEAMERYSGVWRGDEHTVVGTLEQLGDEAIHPNSIMLLSEAQYRDRREWNAAHGSRFHHVPMPFDRRCEMSWTPIWSLTNHRYKLIPSAYCFFGHPDQTRLYQCLCDANGNSAGNTLEEAILQGFMELVERDCVALWWYNRVQRPGVDLDSFALPYVAELRRYYSGIHRELHVLDMTSDLGIPAFAAVSRRTDRRAEDIVLGFGAHFDPSVALLRAITEVNQFLPTVWRTDEKGDTIYWFHDKEAIRWWKTATFTDQPHLLPDPRVPLRRAEDYVDRSSPDLLGDVQTCVELARDRGLEVFVLDQTQPDVGLSVAKVIVPGMRHFWKRFGPGRLYDVPVKLGWLAAPRREDELNPIGIFF